MATAFVAINAQSDTPPQVKRYLNATAANLGVSLAGAVDTFGFSQAPHQNVPNKAVCFGGDEKTFLAVTSTVIYRTTNEFASWAAVQTLTNIRSDTTSAKTGINIVDIAGVPTAVVFYMAASATAGRAMKSADGVTWTDSGDSGALAYPWVINQAASITDTIVYHNTIYMVWAHHNVFTHTIWYYDPGANSFGSFQPGGYTDGGPCFAVWQDQLFLYMYSGAGAGGLYNITSGSAVLATSLHNVPANLVGQGNKAGMFVEPSTNALILFFYHPGANTTIAAGSNGVALPTGTINVADATYFPASGTAYVTTGAGEQTVAYTGKTGTSLTGCTGGTGTMSTGGAVGEFQTGHRTFQCYSYTTGGTLTRLTATVLPLAIRSSLGTNGKATPYVDLVASPGSNAAVNVYFGASGVAGTNWQMYQWNGQGSVMTLIGTGGNVQHSLGVNNRPVGGQYSYTTSQYRVRITARTAAAGGVRYSFKVSSTTGTDLVKVKGYFGDAAVETMNQAATLVNPSAGAIAGAYNTGLTADRTTTYQVTWAAQTDGAAQGSRKKFSFVVEAN